MKKIFYLLSLAAAVTFALVSCQKEITPHEPGEPDDANCYGVYFPAQAASGSHVYNPTQEKVIDITVARTKTNGAIEVPVKASYSEDGVFTATPIKFADGQKETTFQVRFDKAKDGVDYSAHFVIDDNAYASKYNSNPIGIDFSILCVEMLTLKDEAGNPAKVKFSVQPDFLVDFGVAEAYDIDGTIQYYEVDGIRYGTVEVPAEGGIWGSNVVINFTWYPNKEYVYNDVSYQPVEVALQATGYELDGSEVGEDHPCRVLFADYYHYWTDVRANSLGTYFDFMANYGANYKLSFYDGHGGFYFNLVYSIEGTNYWYGFCDSSVVGIADGYLRVDYALKGIETDYTVDGKAPVYVYTGVDVTKVGLVAVAGELTATQINNQVSAIAAGTAEGMITLNDFVEITYKGNDAKGVVAEVAPGATGVYTVIAVTFDGKGAAYDFGTTMINYVAAGDEESKAVDITCGLCSAEKYVAQGVNPDAALEFWLYGTDIVAAKVAAVKYIDLVSDIDNVYQVDDAAELSADAIAAINDGGYVGVVQGLLPGTEYYLVVWASNGFEEDYFLSGSSCFTSGDPLPIYTTFTVNDFDESALLADASKWYGKWNYYAVDYYGDLGLREYIGEVNISASDTPADGPDDNGLYDEYVYVDGLFGDLAQFEAYGYKLDGKLEMDVYSGMMYSCSATNVAGDCKVHIYSKIADGWYNNADYFFSAFIPVMDGYYAFVDVSQYASVYNFTGLRLLSDYVWNAYYDLLLVDPSKDDNGIAPSAVNAAVARARKLISESVAEVDGSNLVLNDKARARAIFNNYNQKQQKCQIFDNTMTVNGTCPVNAVKVEASSKAVPSVAGQKASKSKAIEF